MSETRGQTETEYRSRATIAEIASRIRAAERIALASHSKPDGDAIGSMLALHRAMTAHGKRAEILLMGPIEPNLLIVIGETPWMRVEDKAPSDDFDLIIVVDTGAWAQLDPLEAWLRRNRERVIGIDHHAWGDDVAPVRLIDASCASTTQLLVPLFDELGWSLTGGIGGIAEALFLGLATDTGWFRHNNAEADVFALAARLLSSGVDKSRLYQIIEETHRPQRLDLEALALGSLVYARDGTAAIMSLGMEDFRTTGGSLEDLTGLVNMPMIVGRIRVSILLTQVEPGRTKVSFRSKPPIPGYDENDFIDVNQLAQQFGGGGHVHAAGARLELDLDEAQAHVIRAVEAVKVPASGRADSARGF